jgi:molybdopterin-guanine dinucleotide biosynthesis protein A
MKNINKSDITAVILAGGRARRLSGEDKGLVLFNEKPLITYAVNLLAGKTQRLLISANRNIERYQVFGEVIFDDLADFQGPLAGILAALKTAKTAYLLVVPCDGPFIKTLLISRLVEAMRRTKSTICVATSDGKMQPTFALIHTNIEPKLANYLAAGERKLGQFFKDNHAVEVDFSDESQMFVNLNSPEDFLLENHSNLF